MKHRKLVFVGDADGDLKEWSHYIEDLMFQKKSQHIYTSTWVPVDIHHSMPPSMVPFYPHNLPAARHIMRAQHLIMSSYSDIVVLLNDGTLDFDEDSTQRYLDQLSVEAPCLVIWSPPDIKVDRLTDQEQEQRPGVICLQCPPEVLARLLLYLLIPSDDCSFRVRDSDSETIPSDQENQDNGDET